MKRFLSNVMTYSLLLSFIMTSNVFAGTPTLSNAVIENLNEIAQLLFVVAAAVCVGKCIHIGILYVTSSAVEKSTAKSAMLPWVIGTVVCFGGATLGKFIIKLLNLNQSVLEY